MPLNFVLHGDTTVLDDMQQELQGKTKALVASVGHVVKEAFVEAVRDTFKHEALMGLEWEELNPSTVQRREREGYGGEHPILVRTGHLLESLTGSLQVTEERSAGNVSVHLGTNDRVFPYHQYGTRWMPSRPMVPETEEQQEAFVALYIFPALRGILNG